MLDFGLKNRHCKQKIPFRNAKICQSKFIVEHKLPIFFIFPAIFCLNRLLLFHIVNKLPCTMLIPNMSKNLETI